jgi:hypothetical protein
MKTQASKARWGWTVHNLSVSLLLAFAVVPAMLVGGLLYKSNVQTVNKLSQKIIDDVVQLVQADAEVQLQTAGLILNGLIPPAPSDAQTKTARRLINQPEKFENWRSRSHAWQLMYRTFILATAKAIFMAWNSSPAAAPG